MDLSPTPAGRADEGDAGRHLRNVLGALAVAITDLLAEDGQASGYHPTEQAAMILAATVPGLSQDDLQRRLGLSQPGTTRLVDRLAGRALLIRAPGPDRRTNALHVTAGGAQEAGRALARRHQLLAPITSVLGDTQQREAAALIDQMLATLVHSGSSPWRICRECDQAGCQDGEYECPVDRARLSAGPKPDIQP